jgi:hypothetical protein
MFDHKNCVNLPLAIFRKRLRCSCRFRHGDDVRSTWYSCVIDTGAEKTTIPQKFWHPFARRLGVLDRPRTILKGVGGISVEAIYTELQLEVAGTADVAFPDRPGYPWDSTNPGILSLGKCNVLLAFDQNAVDEFNAKKLNPEKPMESMSYILLGLDAMSIGGICVNWKNRKADLVVQNAES